MNKKLVCSNLRQKWNQQQTGIMTTSKVEPGFILHENFMGLHETIRNVLYLYLAQKSVETPV